MLLLVVAEKNRCHGNFMQSVTQSTLHGRRQQIVKGHVHNQAPERRMLLGRQSRLLVLVSVASTYLILSNASILLDAIKYRLILDTNIVPNTSVHTLSRHLIVPPAHACVCPRTE